MPETRKLLRLLPALVMTGAIFAAASLPGKYQPSFLHGGVDKYAHALAYGFLAASYLFALGRDLPRRFPLRICLATIFICLIYGGLEEWYQSIIPGRRPDRVDLEADMVGVMVVVLFWIIILLKKPAKCRQCPEPETSSEEP
ncbi:MAG: VanZ family protein [Proteobacteria bacterium]|nr:VanZ family protein [Pseudomonadota bacterium]MBU1640189.1 VanZ family protein [Pseudomonadota bacterium]